MPQTTLLTARLSDYDRQHGWCSKPSLRDGIDQGMFDDRPRMMRFVVTFARRYFDAVNRRFDDVDDRKPTQVWQLAFETNDSDEPIILQHLLTGMNAHDTFDLGITAAVTAGDSLEPLQNDFNAANAIIASQVDGILDAIEQVSPLVAQYRKQLMGNDIGFIGAAIKQSRDLAWTFAQQLAIESESNRPKVIDDHDIIFAWFCRRHLNPPPPISDMVKAIAQEESRNTAHNIGMIGPIASKS
jgi:hypothetical protein